MKKFFIPILLSGLLISAIGVWAQDTPTPTPTATPTSTATPTPTATASPTVTPVPTPLGLGPIIKGIKENELRQSLEIKEIRGLKICQELNRCPFTTGEKPYIEFLAKAAKVSEVANDYLRLAIFGVNYKVILPEAKLVRQNWANSEIDDFSVGDIINVFGYLDENDNFLVHGKTVRNLSIQKQHAVFKGVVGTITPPDTFVLQTLEKGNQTVVVTNDTKIIKNEPLVCIQVIGADCPSSTSTAATFSDIKTGEAVIVRGIWDQTLSKIQAESILIGSDTRPFFKNAPKIKEQIQSKFGKILEKLENKGVNIETLKAKIEEIQNRISDMLMQMKLKKGGGE